MLEILADMVNYSINLVNGVMMVDTTLSEFWQQLVMIGQQQ